MPAEQRASPNDLGILAMNALDLSWKRQNQPRLRALADSSTGPKFIRPPNALRTTLTIPTSTPLGWRIMTMHRTGAGFLYPVAIWPSMGRTMARQTRLIASIFTRAADTPKTRPGRVGSTAPTRSGSAAAKSKITMAETLCAALGRTSLRATALTRRRITAIVFRVRAWCFWCLCVGFFLFIYYTSFHDHESDTVPPLTKCLSGITPSLTIVLYVSSSVTLAVQSARIW